MPDNIGKTKLSELDIKLLCQLDYNAHQTLTQLSKKLNRTKEAIGYRIKKLESSRVLLRSHAIIDMSKLNYETFRVYIKWQNMTLREKNQFYDFLAQIPLVWTVAKLHGKWDMAFFIGCKKTNEFQNTWSQIEENYNKRLLTTKLLFIHPFIILIKDF